MQSPYKSKFRVSQTFQGSAHQGLDLVGVGDKTLYATVAGTVEVAGPNDPGGFGTYVRLKADGTGYRYYFGHMSSVAVKVGQHVQPGDKLGVEGSTGRSTGSHCHYEIRRTLEHGSYLDVSALSSIPNKLGAYAMENGWAKEGGKWVYYADGVRQTGWLNDRGRWYLLGADGFMRTGWQKVSGKWYYLSGSGAMKTGWLKTSGEWYYLTPSGAMKTGWHKEKDKWYYLIPSGEMAVGAYPIGGVWYGFSRSGALCTAGTLTVHTDADGRLIAGE